MRSFWLHTSIIINSKGVIIKNLGPNHDTSKKWDFIEPELFLRLIDNSVKSERNSDSIKPNLNNVKPGAYGTYSEGLVFFFSVSIFFENNQGI